MGRKSRYFHRKHRILNAYIILCMAMVAVFSACGSKPDIEPNSSDIAEISTAAGFIASCVEETHGFIASSQAESSEAPEYAYIYDNSLALIALAEVDANWHVRMIADALVFAQSHDRTFNDGRLRNAYTPGNPKTDSGRSITGGRISIRLPGFWDRGSWREDYYIVSTSTGNMAWAMIALCRASETSDGEKKKEYKDAAIRAADFVLTLKSETGGFCAGYEGWDDSQVKVNYKSTEHNIDLIYAFSKMAALVEDSDVPRMQRYLEASEYAKKFVMTMYDPELHCFYTGTEADGETVSIGVIPLDTNSLAILCLKDEEDYFETAEVIRFVEERMTVGAGFDFSTGDLDGIWNEGTAQMALCYSEIGDSDKYDIIMKYLATQASEDGCIPAADRDGVSTGFMVSGSDSPWEFHNTKSIGATSWYAMAQLKFNPLKK